MPYMSEPQIKPEFNSRRLFGITRSKGKMYELGLSEDLHITVPENSEPQELFILAIGTLGDVAAALSDSENVNIPLLPTTLEELSFSASFFDAFIESKFEEKLKFDTILLAASAYYLARRPGSSLVMARRLANTDLEDPVDILLNWTLQSEWTSYPKNNHPSFGVALENIARLLTAHYYDGSGLEELNSTIITLRNQAYKLAYPRELLFIDIISAIVRMRVAASAWTTLPDFTGIASELWATAIRRSHFPKELWPSQMLLGKAGLFSGASGIVQMPTSAGKTRSIEIVLRSGFLSGRTSLAVVVAPFRALCHEIGTALRHEFKEDNVKVNELSDAIQLDFLQEVAELLGSTAPTSKYILVVTPEKLLYVLRQTPTLLKAVGIVVYDEGHQFDSGSRGITYELLLTEIKALLPEGAQTILVSAVIQNAQAIGEWLIGEHVKVVNGTKLMPTSRSVAFASWLERMGQLIFYESENYSQSDYFVPRVIEQQTLTRLPRETVDRYFPRKGESNDIGLYLGLRLAPEGAVAVFCGRKDTAAGFAKLAVDIYARGLEISAPAAASNPDEIRRMRTLFNDHFGEQSVISRAASLGVFVHHGTTPQGIRLCIEYAMQKGLIKFVACTSTLAQGVNLPIRYLIVTGIYQGTEKIKVRDFQNLVGRAGRSGMHTEGLVIFADPDVYDKRRTEPWKFNSSVELLSPEHSEITTSSLLRLLLPILSADERYSLNVNAEVLSDLILSNEDAWFNFADEIISINPRINFDRNLIVEDIRSRRKLLYAVESHLMANRGTASFDEFKAASEQLATATLAYHLASDELKQGIKVLFTKVAEYLQKQEPDTTKQAVYSKTLLGVQGAKEVEQWVNENRDLLLLIDSNQSWLEKTWELFSKQLSDKFFHTVEPKSLPIHIASKWLEGEPYHFLFKISESVKGKKPWGENGKRNLSHDDIIDFCDHTLGFQCSLLLGAIAEFLFDNKTINNNDSAFILFQKSLKYGLPDTLSISIYETGFSDRVIAQRLTNGLILLGYQDSFVGLEFKMYNFLIEEILANYPSYFKSVLASI